jgi:hypothetical protein
MREFNVRYSKLGNNVPFSFPPSEICQFFLNHVSITSDITRKSRVQISARSLTTLPEDVLC